MKWTRTFVRRHGFRKVRAVVEGGRERADSVRRGLRAAPKDTSVVLIHDAARPLVSRDVVERVIAAARRTGAALAAWPVPDTLKESKGRRAKGKRQKTGRLLVKRTISRHKLWLAQTPQGFRWPLAERLMESGGSPTDDVQWAERAGHPVEMVLGSPRNFKVTVPEDFKFCEAILNETRGEKGRR